MSKESRWSRTLSGQPPVDSCQFAAEAAKAVKDVAPSSAPEIQREAAALLAEATALMAIAQPDASPRELVQLALEDAFGAGLLLEKDTAGLA